MQTLIDNVDVRLLSGFLGSGKSTLLNALLRRDDMPPTAVIINEVGEIAIDQALIQGFVGDIALLSSGCICCAVRSDLEAALRDLHLKKLRGLIPDFVHVIIETTGLADPGPVIETLASHPVRQMRYQLTQTISTVDAVHGEMTLDRHPEAVSQIGLADTIVLTKTDLPGASSTIERRIATLNPLARLLRVIKGDIAPAELMQRDDRAARSSHMHEHGDGRRHHHAHHSWGLSAHGHSFNGPLDWDRASAMLASYLREHGDHVLRLKGLLRIDGIDTIVAVHGVRHTLYPPDILPETPTDDVCRLTVIGDEVNAAEAPGLFARIESARVGAAAI